MVGLPSIVSPHILSLGLLKAGSFHASVHIYEHRFSYSAFHAQAPSYTFDLVEEDKG